MRPSFAFGRVVAVAACLIISSLSQAVGQPRGERPKGAFTLGPELAKIDGLTGDPEGLWVRADNEPFTTDQINGVDGWKVYISRRITGPEFNSEAGLAYILENGFREWADVNISVTAPAGTRRDELLRKGWINWNQKIDLYKDLRATPPELNELDKIRDNLRRVEAGEEWLDIELEEEAGLAQAIIDERRRESREFSDQELAEITNDLTTMPPGEADQFIENGMARWNVRPSQVARNRLEGLGRTVRTTRERANEEIERIEREKERKGVERGQ